jgi:solute carrier family 25 phosphate transporter 23/24/25/41
VSRTVVSPLERLKILFQIQSAGREEYKLGVGKALKKMWQEEGWRGFMRGNGTNCIRIVPYSAVQFGSYNFYKRVSSCVLKAWCPSWSQHWFPCRTDPKRPSSTFSRHTRARTCRRSHA